jgi:hypothetical protein
MVPEYSNGWYNNRLNDNQSRITVLWMKADGTYLSNVDDAYAYYRTAGTLQQYLPNQWVFIKDQESGRWLLNGLGFGMG